MARVRTAKPTRTDTTTDRGFETGDHGPLCLNCAALLDGESLVERERMLSCGNCGNAVIPAR